ncbi:hypothetical protein IT407_02280 [Candidatus Uhrbacteria bacterium]|nr:hypothetical protein [Candidatus Uhrbacteria bacterium]
MAIPLTFFLLAWLVLVGLFLLASAISIMMYLRFGIAGSMTFLSTLLFVGVSGLVLFITASYLVSVDWSQSVLIGAPISGLQYE